MRERFLSVKRDNGAWYSEYLTAVKKEPTARFGSWLAFTVKREKQGSLPFDSLAPALSRRERQVYSGKSAQPMGTRNTPNYMEI